MVEIKHLHDAFFMSVELDERRYSRYNTLSGSCATYDFLTYFRRPEIYLHYMVIVGQLSDENAIYLCGAPTTWELPSYSPFAIYEMKLMQVAPLTDVDNTLADLIAKGVPAEWKIVERPLFRGVASEGNFVFDTETVFQIARKNKWLMHYCQHAMAEFAVLDRLGGVLRHESGTNSLPSVEEFPEVQTAAGVTSHSRRPQWLRLCASLVPEVCAGLCMRELHKHIVKRIVGRMESIAALEPWLLFVNGLVDTTLLMMHLRKHGTLTQLRQLFDGLGDVDPERELFWHNVQHIYAQSICLDGPACVYTVSHQPLAEALCRLGLMCRRASDGALLNRKVLIAHSWLVRYVKVLQRMRPAVDSNSAAAALSPNSVTSVIDALLCRNLLVVETALPLNAPIEPSSLIREMREQAVLCLSPTALPRSVEQVQQQFAERMDAIVRRLPDCSYFPMVVIEDAQWWSAHALQFWLTVLHTAPQTGRGFERHKKGNRYKSTGSAALFKLVVCYSLAVEDSGVRATLQEAVAPQHIRYHVADGCPSCTRGTLPAGGGSGERATRAHLLMQTTVWTEAKLSTGEVAALLTTELKREAQNATAVEPIIAYSSKRSSRADTVVIRGAPEAPCAVHQMVCAGALPSALVSPHLQRASSDSQYAPVSVVAVELPVSLCRLTTLLCLVDRIILLE